MNLETLHAIATLVSQQRSVDTVLATLVESLVETWDLALARIWLVRSADLCSACSMLPECPDQTRCLHLVASAARPQNAESGDDWYRQDGFYRRFPLGIRRIGWIGAQGESLRLDRTSEDQEWFARNDWLRREGICSFSGHPLKFREKVLGVLAVFSRAQIDQREFDWLRAFADSAGVAIANAEAFEEIEALRSQLELENEYLRGEISAVHGFGGIIGRSPGLQKALQQVELVAPTESSVLILGESGVGKELIARAIHERSSRAQRAMVKVNCASVPKELFESEFFGHVKGSFTGAVRDRAGRFELADGGTLFLDEIGEIPLDLQSKLLRVLQEGSYERVGDEKTRTTDVRIVAATNRDLLGEVQAKRFRQDLYYRLSVFPIEIAPLRDRKDDIPELTVHFLEQSCRKLGLEPPRLKQRHIIELQQYGWPGNVRELQNVVERAVIRARTGPLLFHLPRENRASRRRRAAPAQPLPDQDLLTEAGLRLLEERNLRAVLEHCRFKVSGPGGAAEFLGVNPATLRSRMRIMGIRKPPPET
jgi:transcriptional regulator with GAF, ATPase, and Fis domain